MVLVLPVHKSINRSESGASLVRSELRAQTGNGYARLKAEAAWLAFGAATGLPVHSFRLAGIYGPGRSALDISSRVSSGVSPDWGMVFLYNFPGRQTHDAGPDYSLRLFSV